MNVADCSSYSVHSVTPAFENLKGEYTNCKLNNHSATSLLDIVDQKGSTEVWSNENEAHWNKRSERIDKALSWIRTELGAIQAHDKVLTAQFQKCQDSIEQLKKQHQWFEVYSDDDVDEMNQWEDWEIDDFDRTYQTERRDMFRRTNTEPTSKTLQSKEYQNMSLSTTD